MGKKVALLLFASALIYLPALGNFFSHDDFFLLRVSRVKTFTDFVNFFNVFHSQAGIGFYRPLTTQVYFFVGSLFGQSPFSFHLISLGGFLLLVWLVFKLAQTILKDNRAALVAALLYATSAINFSRLYWPAIFQETGVDLFVVLSTWLFIKFLRESKYKYYVVSCLAFIAALMSKESAVVLPVILFLVLIYYQKPLKYLALFIALTSFYLYVHFFHYGITSGDSYIWDFSLRALNTLFWYGLWSFNIPEGLVDLVGPGFRINPNLMNYFAGDYLPIIFLVGILIIVSGILVIKVWNKNKRTKGVFLLSAGWFIAGILPVLFLPWHKQSYELGISLFGLVLFLGYILTKIGHLSRYAFVGLWLISAFLTNNLMYRNHWVTTGAREAERVYKYILGHESQMVGKTVVFYDNFDDKNLPWSPTNQIKMDLSGDNFFQVYFPDIKVIYANDNTLYESGQYIKLSARQFLAY